MGVQSALKKKIIREGYRSAEYASSCRHIGEVLPLPLSGGFLLQRPVKGTPFFDLIAPYPLFDVREWCLLQEDFSRLDSEKYISITTVADPFADVAFYDLFRLFPDRHVKLKSHYIADLSRDIGAFVSSGHRYKCRRALKNTEVRHEAEKMNFLAPWLTLYAGLRRRHGFTGPADFPPESLERQFGMEEMHLFTARAREEVVAMHLWLEQGNRVYYHLGASSERGYALRASYAIVWRALHYFKQRGYAFADLGGVAGGDDDPENGLARFKRGFSTGNLPSMLCGKVMNPRVYDRLSRERAPESSVWFPRYRHNEFRSA